MTGGIEWSLTTLFPKDGIIELRALTDHSVHSGYFDDFGLLAEKACVLDGLSEVSGIYVTLNTIKPALLSRRSNRVKMNLGYKTPTTGDGDVLSRRWLPIDLDPVRPSGVSSTDGEHDAALARAEQIAAWLSEQGFPEPVRADSGNGAHLLYRIDLPNDEAATALIKGCLVALDLLFSDDAVVVDPANFNAGRIWKLYGTISRKGDNTTERPHRRSRLISVPDPVVLLSVDLLRTLSGFFPRTDPDVGQRAKSGGINLGAWLSEHGIGVRSERPWQGGTLFSLRECPFSTAHKDGAFAVQFREGGIFAGCHHASCGPGTQLWPRLKGMFGPGELKQRVWPKGQSPVPSEGGTLPGAGVLAKGLPSPPPLPTDPVPTGARLVAGEILQSGDPPGFILDVFSREHIGDHVVAACLLLSVASQSVENTHGLHVAISGNSGKGKSHACRTMINLVPEQYRIRGTVSDKALYYHPLKAGTVLLFDDVTLSDDLQEVLKSATANFREPIEHRTLTSDRQVRICKIPERCVWWLAKVEAAGDDQVMNRMLCVWIDDSKDQDTAVLAHQKDAEARAASSGEDPDVPVCRAIFDLVKEEVLHVRIPYAPQIHFSTAQNRRNPGMLFDLIKCHARLLFMQRERDPQGSVLATVEDFLYARDLFLELAGETGSQETKQTRNEAAALSTIVAMGLEVFTIKHLQDALGLSYHQVYRMLKGYQNYKGMHLGILDKCPAVSYIDATVAEDLYGVELKHREHYFSFDPVLYKTWSARPQIWLDDEVQGPDDRKGPHDVCTLAPGLQTGDANKGGDVRGPGSPVAGCNTVKDTSLDLSLHLYSETHSTPIKGSGAVPGVCDREQNAKISGKLQPESGTGNSASTIARLVCKGQCKVLQRGGKTANVSPLPGLLDHREFERVKKAWSTCDVCHGGAAVFRCKDAQVGICERCYTKLVREWNEGNGVR
ncbi:MAG: hypothetical protein NTV68_14165 [Methanomicrobiales archaeon]|nr:hypothetical protein [Methanomicrobiales archaeon]